jgi:4-hydroxymandelate oxidase
MTPTLRLASVRHTVFGADPDTPARPGLLGYWGERLAPYGVPVAAHRYLAGNRNSVSSMSLRVVEPHRAAGPLDLVIGAHAVPDSNPFLSLSGCYAHRFGDEALVFAVSDQGRLAPFSALRLAQAYPELARILVIALDQSAVPFDDPELADLDPGVDHAVGLLLSDVDGPARLDLLPQRCEVPPDGVDTAVREALAGRPVDLVIAGPRVGRLTGQSVRRAPADQLCTAVWTALAAELERPAPGPRRIALVDYEPTLRYLAMAIIDDPGGRP